MTGALLPVQIALCLAVLPALYRALGEPGQGWGGGGAAIARRVLFAALGTAVLFLVTERWVPQEGSGGQGRGFQSYVIGVQYFRISHTAFDVAAPSNLDPTMREAALRELRAAVEHVPESAAFHRSLGIALAEAGKYKEAHRELLIAARRLAARDRARAALERELWTELYGPRAPTLAEIRKLQARLETLNLGWMGRVALLAAYQRHGLKAVPPDLRRRVNDEARRHFHGYLAGVVVPVLLLPQLGLIVLIVGWVLIRSRVLRPPPFEAHPVGFILWESFILMMALALAPAFALLGGQRPSPESQPALFAGLLLVNDAVQALAVVYLWWRLRRRGLSLAEVGLSTRGAGANMGIGVLAALAVIPLAHLLAILTQALSDRYFPHVAPPYHPLGGLTATSGSGEIRLALFLAAVVGAPLLEEIFFRGALHGALRRRFGLWVGIVGSSAFFAALHPQLPLGFVPIAGLGAAFAALYEWRKSLIPGMVAHAANNALVFLFLTLIFPSRG